MFWIFVLICVVCTCLFLVKSVNEDRHQQDVLERINREVDSQERNLYSGNSRRRNG
jgi:hypothetical protein